MDDHAAHRSRIAADHCCPLALCFDSGGPPVEGVASTSVQRQVTATDPAFQCGRRLIPLGFVVADFRLVHQSQRRALGEVSELVGIDDSVAAEVRRRHHHPNPDQQARTIT